VPLAYLVLAEFELQDLTVRIEARAAGKPADEYRSYLLAEETPA
jgi:vacuolar-type H+-ATPase subunit C/Vma6